MKFELKESTRKQVPMKMALRGCSSSGKSMGALLIAKGLANDDLSHVAVIDTENSINLYSHVGKFKVLNLSPPFSPERYIQAIETCEQAGIKVIILDSISHCWYYLLQLHSTLTGNSFTNWNRITPLYNAFIEKILQSPCHIISTIRTKQDYVIQVKDGKTSIEKVGLKAIQRDEIEYEFTLVLDIDINHQARAIKDRTGVFANIPNFIIQESTGVKILDWCNSGLCVDDVRQQIKITTSIQELTEVYNKHPEWFQLLSTDFVKQKKLLTEQQTKNSTNQSNLENHENNRNQAV